MQIQFCAQQKKNSVYPRLAIPFVIIVGRVAQSVEHWSNKPTVPGSSPVTTNTFSTTLTLTCSKNVGRVKNMHTLKQGLFSSVGRASDWRSEGPWFNPRWRHFSFFPSTLITIFNVRCATTPQFFGRKFFGTSGAQRRPRYGRTEHPPIVGAQNRPSVVGAQLTVCCAKFQHMASGNKNLKKILAENYFLACNQVELRCYVITHKSVCFMFPLIKVRSRWKGLKRKHMRKC